MSCSAATLGTHAVPPSAMLAQCAEASLGTTVRSAGCGIAAVATVGFGMVMCTAGCPRASQPHLLCRHRRGCRSRASWPPPRLTWPPEWTPSLPSCWQSAAPAPPPSAPPLALLCPCSPCPSCQGPPRVHTPLVSSHLLVQSWWGVAVVGAAGAHAPCLCFLECQVSLPRHAQQGSHPGKLSTLCAVTPTPTPQIRAHVQTRRYTRLLHVLASHHTHLACRLFALTPESPPWPITESHPLLTARTWYDDSSSDLGTDDSDTAGAAGEVAELRASLAAQTKQGIRLEAIVAEQAAKIDRCAFVCVGLVGAVQCALGWDGRGVFVF